MEEDEDYLRKPTMALCQLGVLFTSLNETGLSVMILLKPTKIYVIKLQCIPLLCF
jgi:hypothetical protein